MVVLCIGVSSAAHLAAHARLHRSTSVCAECGKRFLSASHLAKHRVVHTPDARPFICATCGKTFRDAYSLKAERAHLFCFFLLKMDSVTRWYVNCGYLWLPLV
jgi:DNA-directed RNA polymerase subunit RPC12/RpoP